jgi:nucleoside-diphosphate-sugar epimerase
MQVIAVTGATGFIGSRLVNALISAGYQPRALVRSPKAGSALAAKSVEVIRGGLSDPEALNRLCEGASAVVHCAGTVRGRRLEDFLPANVDGTRHLVRALAAGPRAPLLVLSSLAARAPHLSHYARSKQLTEEVLQHESDGLDWTALRPPAVYGPGDKELMPLFRLMSHGLAPIPSSPANRVSVIHVDDLVDAILKWIAFSEDRQTLRRVFPISDPAERGYDWQEIADIVSRLAGRPVRLWQMPAVLLDSLAVINRSLAGLFSYAPMLTPEKLRELRHPDWVCNSNALSEALDWSPTITLREGLAELLTTRSSTKTRNRLG